MPRMGEAEFEALLRRAGLPLTAEQRAGIYPAVGAVEAMQERIRAAAPVPLPAEAEPATTFSAGRG